MLPPSLGGGGKMRRGGESEKRRENGGGGCIPQLHGKSWSKSTPMPDQGSCVTIPLSKCAAPPPADLARPPPPPTPASSPAAGPHSPQGTAGGATTMPTPTDMPTGGSPTGTRPLCSTTSTSPGKNKKVLNFEFLLLIFFSC